MRTCKIEGCNEPRSEGAFLCLTHLGEKRRCAGIVKTYDDEGNVISERQCKRSARPGNTTCSSHGANSPRAKASAAKAQVLTTMQRFVKPYEGPLDPFMAFEGEYRRTYGRIIWLEDQIANLDSEDDLVWGKTKSEDISATEFAGTNVTYEARINVWEDMLRWERKHLLELNKVAFKMNVEEQRLTLMRQYLEGTYAATLALLRDLGHDTADPLVRARLRRMFEGAPEPAKELMQS